MHRILIIGAGLAGLTCAKVLRQDGIEDFLILEKSDSPGGRVKTDPVDGFYLDRGFQVLFTAYPAVKRHLDLAALHVKKYRPGAILVKQGKHYKLGDPLRDLSSLLPTLVNPLVPLSDKVRLMQLRIRLATQTPANIFGSGDLTTQELMGKLGFSDATFKHFLQPFYRGILLDRDLTTSARLFQFYFKMLSEGDIVTPSLGLGQISLQLASHLSSHHIQYQAEVSEILSSDRQVTGVKLRSGEIFSADQVVCATDPPTARRLLGLEIPDSPRAVCCLYFRSPQSFTTGAYLHLNATGKGWINNCVELTQISAELAPAGQHLYSVTGLGDPALADHDLIAQCEEELQAWFPEMKPDQLECLRVYRIPFAQFAQPVGFYEQRPSVNTAIQGLLCAGDYTQHSSIEGAIDSGERAALELIGA